MECVDGDESCDSEVFVSPDTVAALQAKIKPGRHKNSQWPTKLYNGIVEV